MITAMTFVVMGVFGFLPVVFAQTPVYDVQVPRASSPVTLDGEIKRSEYEDAANRSLTCYNPAVAEGLMSGNVTCSTLSRLYIKYDSQWTYFGFDNPEGIRVYNTFYNVGALLNFDIDDIHAKDNRYRLSLMFENQMDIQPHEKSDPYCCTSMYQVYMRGKDYNWRFHFGPSSLSSNPHVQFEIQFSTKLLASYSRPRFAFSFCCAGSTKGVLGFPGAESAGFATLHFSEPITYRLTVNATSAYVTVTIDGQARRPGQTSLVTNSTGEHVISVPRYLTPSPNIRLYFVRWSDGSSLPERTVTLTQNVTLEAKYTTLYKLTLNSHFGNITGDGWYLPGSEVNFSILNATSQSKTEFGGWYENGTLIKNSMNSTIVMDRPYNLTAMWLHIETATNLPVYFVALVLVAGLGATVTIVVVHKRKAATESSKRT